MFSPLLHGVSMLALKLALLGKYLQHRSVVSKGGRRDYGAADQKRCNGVGGLRHPGRDPASGERVADHLGG